MDAFIKQRGYVFLPQLILEAIDNPIVLKNEYGVVLSCNEAYIKLHQTSRQKVLGFKCEDYLPPEIAALHARADFDLLNSPLGIINYDCHKSVGDGLSLGRKVITKTVVSWGEDLPREILTVVGVRKNAAINRVSPERILTIREYSVLSLMVKGRSQKQIAQELGISHHTVADYCKSIYLKLDVNSRTAAQLVAITKLGIAP
jgi:DNA-binding CsgD family transcriptional regulator